MECPWNVHDKCGKAHVPHVRNAITKWEATMSSAVIKSLVASFFISLGLNSLADAIDPAVAHADKPKSEDEPIKPAANHDVPK
jgi:hypothetical protein